MRNVLSVNKCMMVLACAGLSMPVFSNDSKLAKTQNDSKIQPVALQRVDGAPESKYKKGIKLAGSVAAASYCVVRDLARQNLSIVAQSEAGFKASRLLCYSPKRFVKETPVSGGLKETFPLSSEDGQDAHSLTFYHSGTLSMEASFDGEDIFIKNYGCGARAMVIDRDFNNTDMCEDFTSVSREATPQDRFLLASTSSLWKKSTPQECLRLFKDVYSKDPNQSDAVLARSVLDRLVEKDPGIFVYILPLERILEKKKKNLLRSAGLFTIVSSACMALGKLVSGMPSMSLVRQ